MGDEGSNIQYFLGVGGEPSGPFSEEAILQQIRDDKLPEDTLVWAEGFSTWQPIGSVPAFAEAIRAFRTTYVGPSTGKVEDEEERAPESKPPSGEELKPFSAQIEESSRRWDPDKNPFKKKSSEEGFPGYRRRAEPIFQAKDSFFGVANALSSRAKIFIATFATLGLIFFVGVYLKKRSSGHEKDHQTPATLVKAGPRGPRLRQALSELLLKSRESLQVLNDLIRENPNDSVSREAVEAMVRHYQTNREPEKAGQVLVAGGRPLEAVPYFLEQEPPAYTRALNALNLAYGKVQNEEERFQVLDKQIKLLLGPMDNESLAMEKINELKKFFPGRVSEYSFYLQEDSKKVESLFGRLKFYFERSLLVHLENQFPQLTLSARPKVSLNNEVGRYRIVGNYEGSVELNRDRLTNITLRFWNFEDTWYLVETNLTKEREKAARAERARKQDAVLDSRGMLNYLTQLYRSEFPKQPLHELSPQRAVADEPANRPAD